ncbi:MAG TPA: SAM-dependent methyltransferase [Steroidobacteraceae bacterium]
MSGRRRSVAPLEVIPIGFVESGRRTPQDDYWGGEQACIRLSEEFSPLALEGLVEFSHVEVLFVLHLLDPAGVVCGSRHPRDNPLWPCVGIFAQRASNRPNRIGSTMCRVLRVLDRQLFVADLDAIDGTPVLDLKPVMQEFLPREALRQPEWSRQLMREYWSRRK